MIPVIFIIGCPSSGKSTLGARLAADFRLHHISLADEFKELIKIRRGPIEGMSEEINTYLKSRMEIPEELLSLGKNVPVVLQVHNRCVRDDYKYDLAPAVLKEKIEDAMSSRGIPRAIIVEGLTIAIKGCGDVDMEQAIAEFSPSYSGLTLLIHCSRQVAKRRFQMCRSGSSADGDTFDKRMASYETVSEKLLKYFKKDKASVVVRSINDNNMTVDEAYTNLLANLDGIPLWNFLIGKKKS